MLSKTGLTDVAKVRYLINELDTATLFSLALIGDRMIDGSFSDFLTYFCDIHKQESKKVSLKPAKLSGCFCGIFRNCSRKSKLEDLESDHQDFDDSTKNKGGSCKYFSNCFAKPKKFKMEDVEGNAKTAFQPGSTRVSELEVSDETKTFPRKREVCKSIFTHQITIFIPSSIETTEREDIWHNFLVENDLKEVGSYGKHDVLQVTKASTTIVTKVSGELALELEKLGGVAGIGGIAVQIIIKQL